MMSSSVINEVMEKLAGFDEIGFLMIYQMIFYIMKEICSGRVMEIA